MNIKRGIAALILLVLSGCAAINPPVRTTTEGNASLIYGFFDLSKAPAPLDSVRLTQGERAGIAYRQSDMTTFNDGLFFVENVPPMDYHIPWFMAGGVMYSFGGNAEDLMHVPSSSLVFVGSYTYHDPQKGGILTAKKFEMKPSKKPSEKEVLKKLLPHVQDARWKKRIKDRLKELK